MAKTKKVQQASDGTVTVAGGVDSPKPPVRVDRIAIRGLTYKELPITKAPTPVNPGTSVEVRIDLQGRMRIVDGAGEIRLVATVRPDAEYQPVELTLDISGFFRREGELSDEDFLNFLRSAGVRIVFPYLREIVSNTTSRGLFPAVWIDPISLQIADDPGAFQVEEQSPE